MKYLVVAAGAALGLAAAASADMIGVPVPDGTKMGHMFIDLTNGSYNTRQTPIYSNLTTGLGSYFPMSSAGAPVGDDLHMTAAGNMVQFSFVYYDPAGNTQLTDAFIHFYGNDPSDSDFPGNPATGGSPWLATYQVSGLPGDGAWIITVAVPPTPLPQDIWMELDNPISMEAGLYIYDPPTVGSSHDAFEIFANGIYWFGGNPVANFGLEVAVPAPASLALLGLGGLLVGRRRR